MPDDEVDLLLELLGCLLEDGMVEGSRCFGETGERLLVYFTLNTGVVVKDVDPSMGWEGDFILRSPVAGGDHCISVASHDYRQRRNGQCTEIAPKSRPN